MIATAKKELDRIRRHERIRMGVAGTIQRPRVSLHLSHKNLIAQLIDDVSAKTILSASTLEKRFREIAPQGGNLKAAEALGEHFAKKAKEKQISRVVFDRGGYKYHGRIRAFAEAARKAGLDF